MWYSVTVASSKTLAVGLAAYNVDMDVEVIRVTPSQSTLTARSVVGGGWSPAQYTTADIPASTVLIRVSSRLPTEFGYFTLCAIAVPGEDT